MRYAAVILMVGLAVWLLWQRRAALTEADIPPGTVMVQLGAYDSAADAQAHLAAVQAQAGALVADKPALVIEAKSDGRRFYRLRLTGFDAPEAARRLCGELMAGLDLPCIPVVKR